jgi:hypothetical protein
MTACLWLAPRIGEAGIVLGPDTELSFLADHYFVSVAVLEDGSFALGGTTTVEPDGNPQDGHPQFQVQAYSPEGAPLGEPFIPQPAYPVDTGSIGSLGDHYFVSWQHYLDRISRARMLSREGQVMARAFGWPNSDIEFYGSYDRYGAGPAWAFLPIIYRQAGVDALGNTIRAPTLQAYGPDAKPLGPAALVAGRQWLVRIDDAAINGEGRFVVVTDQCLRKANATCRRVLQVFDATSRPQTPLLGAGLPPLTENNTPPLVAMDPAGGFLELWDQGTATLDTLLLRTFDRSGTPGAALTTLAKVKLPSDLAVPARVVAIGGGRYAIFWGVYHSGDGTETLYLSEFHLPDLLDPPVPIATNASLGGLDPYHLAINDSGHGVVVWVTVDQDNVFTGHLRSITIAAGGDLHTSPAPQPGPAHRAASNEKR